MEIANVVFVGNFLYPRGMAETKRVQYFIDGVRAGNDVSIAVLLLRQNHPGRDDSNLDGELDGIPYVTVGADIRLDWRLPFALAAYFVRGVRWLWARRIKKGPNYLFLYGEPNLESMLFILVARLFGYLVVVDIVEDSYNVGYEASFLANLKAASARFSTRRIRWFADAAVVISKYLGDKFHEIGKGKLPVFIIPASADLGRVRASDSEFHSPVRVFYAGSFGEKDAVENLIKAFSRVETSYPDIELELTGKGLPSRMDMLKRWIDTSPSANKIRYLGYLSDEEYFERLSNCDIPCMVRDASAYADRGFPFKLAEYLASGRPVIASATGDVPFFLADRESAYLIEPGSIDAIVMAIECAIRDPEQALRIGRRGRTIAERYFDSVANGRQLLEIFAGLDATSSVSAKR